MRDSSCVGSALLHRRRESRDVSPGLRNWDNVDHNSSFTMTRAIRASLYRAPATAATTRVYLLIDRPELSTGAITTVTTHCRQRDQVGHAFVRPARLIAM